MTLKPGVTAKIKIDYDGLEIWDHPSGNKDWVRNGDDMQFPGGFYHIGYSYKPQKVEKSDGEGLA